MKPNDLVLRCYAKKEDDQWVALCIDLDLAAQADSLEEVRKSLENQIKSYLYDALEGDDVEYAGQLLTRKAPFFECAKFSVMVSMHKLLHSKNEIFQAFSEKLPMKLA